MTASAQDATRAFAPLVSLFTEVFDDAVAAARTERTSTVNGWPASSSR